MNSGAGSDQEYFSEVHQNSKSNCRLTLFGRIFSIIFIVNKQSQPPPRVLCVILLAGHLLLSHHPAFMKMHDFNCLYTWLMVWAGVDVTKECDNYLKNL